MRSQNFLPYKSEYSSKKKFSNTKSKLASAAKENLKKNLVEIIENLDQVATTDPTKIEDIILELHRVI